MVDLLFSTYTLSNGLRVHHHHAPGTAKVVVNVLYHVGAKHEDPSRTGFAHLFEHLMFGGSAHIPDYDLHVEKAGGSNNAFTTNDITNYYIELPAPQLETGLWLESDRMLQLAFSQKSLDVQKSVVIEEFKQRYLNQPYGDAYLKLRPVMFTQHPYRWMTIGEKLEHIEAATLQDVETFFYAHYAPNNATLVIAGDVEEAPARELVEKWFGGIPRREIAPYTPHPEPVQTAARYLEATSPGLPQTQVYKAYHIPGRADATYHSAEFWSEVLTGGRNALLYRRLVEEKQVATSIGAFSWQLFDTGKFSLNAQLANGVRVEAYEAALAEALAELQAVPEAELTRQKTKLMSREVFERTEVNNRAQGLAFFDAIGDANRLNTELAELQALSHDEFLAFATRYFTPQNCTTLVYAPSA